MSIENVSIAVVMLEPRCNMQCLFCITENTIQSVSYAKALELLEWLQERNFKSVVLGGGEPFLWKGNVIRLAHAAKEMGWEVQVGTNGTLLPEGFEQVEFIDRYVLPLDAATAADNDNLRLYYRSHHALILGRLQKLKSAGKEVTLSTIVTAQNILGLKSLADFFRDYVESGGLIHAWHLYQFLPEGRGGKPNQSTFTVSEADYNQACAEMKKENLPFKIFKRRDMYHSTSVDFFWRTKGIWQSAKMGAICAPGEARTPDLMIRSHALYPTELQAREEGHQLSRPS